MTTDVIVARLNAIAGLPSYETLLEDHERETLREAAALIERVRAQVSAWLAYEVKRERL